MLQRECSRTRHSCPGPPPAPHVLTQVDDSRQTLSYALRELAADVAAQVRAGREGAGCRHPCCSAPIQSAWGARDPGPGPAPLCPQRAAPPGRTAPSCRPLPGAARRARRWRRRARRRRPPTWRPLSSTTKTGPRRRSCRRECPSLWRRWDGGRWGRGAVETCGCTAAQRRPRGRVRLTAVSLHSAAAVLSVPRRRWRETRVSVQGGLCGPTVGSRGVHQRPARPPAAPPHLLTRPPPVPWPAWRRDCLPLGCREHPPAHQAVSRVCSSSRGAGLTGLRRDPGWGRPPQPAASAVLSTRTSCIHWLAISLFFVPVCVPADLTCLTCFSTIRPCLLSFWPHSLHTFPSPLPAQPLLFLPPLNRLLVVWRRPVLCSSHSLRETIHGQLIERQVRCCALGDGSMAGTTALVFELPGSVEELDALLAQCAPAVFGKGDKSEPGDKSRACRGWVWAGRQAAA